jgi:Concanavalin A-like lectin/glucanases superfamily/Family of unknown function (DUF6067)
MRSESESRLRIVFRSTALPTLPVGKALSLILAVLTTALLQLAPAHGHSMRTYVSGIGTDSNPRSVTMPCQTLQAALAKTLARGQIYTLGSTNYGPVTINKMVSVISGRGATGVLAAGVTGITNNAGTNDIVNLQGLGIDRAGSGANGVLFNSGAALNVKESVIRGFTNAINFQPSGSSALSIATTVITNDATGVLFRNSAGSTGVLSDVQLVNNGTGISAAGTSSTAPATVTIQNTLVSANSTVGIPSAGNSNFAVTNSIIVNNGVGLQAQNTTALPRVSQSTVTGNVSGWLSTIGGHLYSATTNSISGNTAGNTAPPTDPAPAPALAPTSTPAPVAADIPPASILYAGFNSGVVATSSVNLGSNAVFVPNGRIGQGLAIPASALSTSDAILQNRRGTVAFWIRLDTQGDMDSVLSGYPGPPYWKISVVTGTSGKLSISFAFDGAAGGAGSVQDTLDSDTYNFAAGDWHHFVWTWQGTHHRLYRDGALVNDKILTSAMPNVMAGNFRIGGGYGAGTATLDELAVSNYPYNLTDVATSYNATSSGPISPSGGYGMDAVAQWAPGNGNAFLMVDAGNNFATRTNGYAVNVLLDNSSVAAGTISALNNGFGQALVPVALPFAPGKYTAQVSAVDANGKQLSSQITSSFVVPATSWLGNTLGIAAAGTVQAPWIPISVNQTALSVWGRTYTLAGGWGLPQQITSQGQNLLAVPIDVDFDIGSGKFNLTPQSLAITSAASDVATWTGQAAGNDISATINGSLEYDGMVLIRMTLTPTNGPVTIQTMKLQTAMPATQARFYLWAATSSLWGGSYNPVVPGTPGVFLSNTYAGLENKSPGKSRLLPSITLSNDDTGLEWFADNLAGWSVDQSIAGSTPFQTLIVDQNTNVRLENAFATQAFTLTAPVTITFGYMATPTKARPVDWRAVQIGNVGGKPTIRGLYTAMWSWPDSSIRNKVWRSFALSPGSATDVNTDTAAVLSREATLHRNGVSIAPFVNQHVLIAPSLSPPNDTPTVLGFLSQEVASPDGGYTNMPTRGSTDYWLASIDYNLSASTMDAVYIDEPFYGWQATAAPISGSGFTDQSGINRVGYNSLGVRAQLKRVRQSLIDHGRRPTIWINASTGYVAPHMWSFAEYISDGEGVNFAIGTDFVNQWGTPNGLNWLRANSRSQKYGFTPLFFDYISAQIPGSSLTPYYRSMVAVLQLMDIDIQGHYISQWVAYMQPRVNFGITAPDVTFTGFWSNPEIAPDNTALCSYYKRANKVLAHCANLSTSAYSGTVTFNATALGLTGTVTAIDAESGSPIPIANGQFPIVINRHDYRVLVLSGG